MKPLEQAYHFYLAYQEDLIKRYDGKYIVIQGTEVLGAYDDQLEAVQEPLKQGLSQGPFLFTNARERRK